MWARRALREGCRGGTSWRVPQASSSAPAIKEAANTPKAAGFWASESNQRSFIETFAEERGLRSPADWNLVTREQIAQNGGRRLISLHSSLFGTLKALYPEQQWDPITVPLLVPRSYFEDEKNLHSFIERVASLEKLQPQQVTRALLCRHNGKRFLLYGHKDALLQYQGLTKAEAINWNDLGKQREFLDSLIVKLGIKEPFDWVNVTHQRIKEYGGAGLLSRYPRYRDMFPKLFPEIDWKAFSPPKSHMKRLRGRGS